MTERQKQILALVIREYVDTGIPVGSKELVKKYELPFSSATLRTELARFCDTGYLIQPHISAGRIPADKGYRFYIKHLMEPHGILPEEKNRIQKNLRRNKAPSGRNIARVISESTHNLGFYFDPEQEALYREGLAEVVRSPDFRAIDQVYEFIEFLDFIERQLMGVFDALWRENEPTVLIGRNSLLPMGENYSILYSGYERGGHDHMIGVLGPNRMDYARNLAILDFIRGELTHEGE